MSLPAGTQWIGGIACTPDGAVYVEPTGSASITGGDISNLTSLSLTTGAISRGAYTPTLTNSTNIAASTAQLCQWMRIGDMVFVFGGASIDPTSASVQTQLRISLPIASNFSTGAQGTGVAACPLVAGYSAALYSDSANDNMILEFVCGTDVANRSWTFLFGYQVI